MNKFLVGFFLGISMLANVAYAEISPNYVKNVLQDNNGWPLTMICTGSDVNLRTEANTNCEVIDMLQKGDVFYVKDVINGTDYTWFKGVTAKGQTGFMVSKYLDQAPRAANKNERFRAAFLASTIYDGERLAKAMGLEFKYRPELVETLKDEVFHYASHRYKVGSSWVHGEKENDGSFHTIGVILENSGYDRNYNIAGLEVGQKIDLETLKAFSKNMNMIGWEEPYEINMGMEECYWYVHDTVDGQQRPVEGFGIKIKNGYISQIRYWHIPID